MNKGNANVNLNFYSIESLSLLLVNVIVNVIVTKSLENLSEHDINKCLGKYLDIQPPRTVLQIIQIKL